MGLLRVIQEVGADRFLSELKATMSPEQWRALIAKEGEKEGGA